MGGFTHGRLLKILQQNLPHVPIPYDAMTNILTQSITLDYSCCGETSNPRAEGKPHGKVSIEAEMMY